MPKPSSGSPSTLVESSSTASAAMPRRSVPPALAATPDTLCGASSASASSSESASSQRERVGIMTASALLAVAAGLPSPPSDSIS
eukprot:2070580-Pleurochrysis_carterae.AAC.5